MQDKTKYIRVFSLGILCFQGYGLRVFEDVTIGARSIIAAGSVVVKNIPAGCIAGGNPARMIKKLL